MTADARDIGETHTGKLSKDGLRSDKRVRVQPPTVAPSATDVQKAIASLPAIIETVVFVNRKGLDLLRAELPPGADVFAMSGLRVILAEFLPEDEPVIKRLPGLPLKAELPQWIRAPSLARIIAS